MANLWNSFTPTWPTFDCPDPHYIGIVSGLGCALSEGWANFWAWYSNEFYDGDGVNGNEGPIFNWPSGASTNLETRDGGTYQPGDHVEGNIAAVFGDIIDAANDGPSSGPSDGLTDGIQHIWHTLSSQSESSFSQWFSAYWSTFGHDPCPVLSIINFNSIAYSLAQCAQPVVTVTATTPNASETGPTPGVFTVSRTGSTASALTVFYALGGAAMNGVDYQSLPGNVTIPAGQGSTTITVTPIDDNLVEGSEAVVIQLQVNAAYTLGALSSATVIIADNDTLPPTVTVVATTPNASETGPTPGVFTVSRTGSTASALTVFYALGGAAINGVDYQSLPGSVTIPVGQSSTTITVTPIDDSLVEGDEAVAIQLQANGAYALGTPSGATVIIADNDTPPLPTVTVVATSPNASEAGPTAGVFTVSRTGSAASALTVFYALGGAAINGVDYQSLPGSVTIPAGQSSTTITVIPIDDNLVEGNEAVAIQLQANGAYTLGTPSGATVIIADNDTPPLPTVTVTAATPNASEAGPTSGVFTVSRTGSTASALTVFYALGGAAINGVDYQSLPGSVTIPAGQSSTTITVIPIDDNLVEGNEAVVVQLQANGAYALGTPNSATVIIADNDTVAPVVRTGVFRPSAGWWFLDLNGNSQWDGCGIERCSSFGVPGTDVPVVGDWTGTGTTKIGIFRNGQWFLDLNGNGQWDGCGVERCGSFGVPGDIPVVGDWTGTGTTKVGVFRNGQWFLDLNGNALWDGCGVERCGSFGLPGDIPVVGDWTGTGTTKVGVFRNGQWFLDLNGNALWDGCGVERCGSFGLPGDIPVVGDWTGTGTTKIGVFRPSAGWWFLDLNGNGQWDGCGVDLCGSFGVPGADVPVVGDWTGTGTTKIGIFRNGQWFLDLNGNGQWDGCGVERCGSFGVPGDIPVVGKW
jgi:hypothetical protein